MIQTHTQRDRSTDALLGQVAEEFFERIARGESPQVDEYAEKYPQIAELIREIFPALDLVKDSLSGRTQKDQRAVIDPAKQQQLGDFRIVRELGRGGMGMVYEAEQLSLGRRVALKVLPLAAVLGQQQLQRFQNEARAAATLEHPSIVSVHAVGCDRGVHYYAMRLIEGQTLEQVIRELRRLSDSDAPDRQVRRPEVGPLTRQLAAGSWEPPNQPASGNGPTTGRSLADSKSAALSAETPPTMQAVISTDRSTKSAPFFRSVANLGIQAAEALDHAHERGVLHRDIKPGNLMLDAEGHLWVTDFGLARIEADPGMTMTGDILGTLRYMSPEQALAKRVVVDHRADIYSLGVTLYELLTLEPALKGDDRESLLNQITFDEPAPPRRINQAIPWELETIVLKAIRKTPEERYGTAQELADDLRHFLHDKPIQAQRPTLVEKMTKWSRRHRAAVASLMVMLLMFALASVTSTALVWTEHQKTITALQEATQQRTLAEQASSESQAVVDFLVNDLLGAAEPEQAQGQQVTVDEVLARADKKIDTALNEQPLVEAAIRHTMGKTYFGLGQYDAAERHLLRSREIRTRLLGPEDPDTLHSESVLATVFLAQDNIDEALELYEEILEIRRRVLGPEHPDALQTKYHLAIVFGSKGEYEKAHRLHQETLELRRRILGSEHPSTLESMEGLAGVFYRQGKHEESGRIAREALDLRRRIHGAEHPGVRGSMMLVANSLRGQGKYVQAVKLDEEVLQLTRRIFGPDHPKTIGVMMNMGNSLRGQGKYDAARQLGEEALEISRRVLGPEHSETLGLMNNLAITLEGEGKYDEALKLLEALLPLRRQTNGHGHPNSVKAIRNSVRLLQRQGKDDEARNLLEEDVELARENSGPESGWLMHAMHRLGKLSLQQGRLDEARTLLEETLEMRRRIMPETRVTGNTMQHLANVLKEQGEFMESCKLHAETLELRRRILGPENLDTLDEMSSYAFALQEQGKLKRACQLFEELLELQRRILGPEAQPTLSSEHGLANVIGYQGNLEEAKLRLDAVVQRKPGELDTCGMITSKDARMAMLYTDQGRVDWYLEDYEPALAHFEEAIQVDPKSYYAHYWLAWLLATCPESELRDADRATKLSELAITLRPHPFCWRSLGAARYLAEDFGGAVAALEKADELRAQDPRTGFFVAMTKWQLDQKEEAQQWHHQATERIAEAIPADQAELHRLRVAAAQLMGSG